MEQEKLNGLFTSESVSPGHPDKVADLIADRLLDAYLEQDPESHVAIEMLIGRGHVVIGGNVKSKAIINVDSIVRETLREIGYTHEELGASADYISIFNVIDKQSSDIDDAVLNALETRDTEEDADQGAGDQGMMFGYASNETKELMPLAIAMAHALVRQATDLMHNGVLDFARPDMKSQVTVRYVDGKPVGIDTVVFSCQHNPDVTNEQIRKAITDKVIIPVLNHYGYDHADRYIVNPSGRFVIGGPTGDSGVVGRKIVVDTYGGYAPIGGGCFSGKDPSKVDRSAAYMARYVAKNIVAAGLAEKCEVQLAYAIGKAEPVSVCVKTFGTGKVSNTDLVKAIKSVFDLRPIGIIKTLDLKKPIYHLTTNYGHFGKDFLPWEKIDKVVALLDALDYKGE